MSSTAASPAALAELVERAVDGDRRAVGRLLTRAELGGVEADELTDVLHSHTSGAHVIGITGPPGSGKSTLVGQLIIHLLAADRRPAVLAVDPSSPLTGGAILGDRVRMDDTDDRSFIRSMATRGHAGGLALAVPGAIRVFNAAGYDPVIIETVGVGQVEVDVSAAADTTVVVVTPGAGDAVQANKAGLLEVADVFVVNKADRPGASDARRDLELMLDLSHVTGHEDIDRRPPILMTNALDGDGVGDVCDSLVAHHAYLIDTGTLDLRRHRRVAFEIASRIDAVFERSREAVLADENHAALIDAVAAGTMSPTDATRTIAAAILRDP